MKFLLLLFLFLPVSASAQISINDRLGFIGDNRILLAYQTASGRDGENINHRAFFNRTRAGLTYGIQDNLQFTIRYGIRLSDTNYSLSPHWHTTGEYHFGSRPGEGAFDMAYFRYQPSGNLAIQLGRFQSTGVVWSVPGVVRYSLFRHESSGASVQWIDGAQLSYNYNKWSGNFQFQWNHLNAPTNTQRAPLQIAQATPGVSLYSNLYRVNHDNLLRLLMFNIMYVPDALPADTRYRRTDYVKASVKSTLGWELMGQRELLWENEVGYNFSRPDKAAIGLSGNNGDKPIGTALMSSLSYVEFIPTHSIGVMGAVVPMIFATSPMLDNNLLQLEIRHIWDITNSLQLHTFIRYQRDLERVAGAAELHEGFFPVMWLTYTIH